MSEIPKDDDAEEKWWRLKTLDESKGQRSPSLSPSPTRCRKDRPLSPAFPDQPGHSTVTTQQFAIQDKSFNHSLRKQSGSLALVTSSELSADSVDPDLQSENTQLRLEIDALNRSFRGQVNHLRQHNETLQKELTSVRRKLLAKKELISELKGNLERMTKENGELKELKFECQSLRLQLETLQKSEVKVKNRRSQTCGLQWQSPDQEWKARRECSPTTPPALASLTDSKSDSPTEILASSQSAATPAMPSSMRSRRRRSYREGSPLPMPLPTENPHQPLQKRMNSSEKSPSPPPEKRKMRLTPDLLADTRRPPWSAANSEPVKDPKESKRKVDDRSPRSSDKQNLISGALKSLDTGEMSKNKKAKLYKKEKRRLERNCERLERHERWDKRDKQKVSKGLGRRLPWEPSHSEDERSHRSTYYKESRDRKDRSESPDRRSSSKEPRDETGRLWREACDLAKLPMPVPAKKQQFIDLA